MFPKAIFKHTEICFLTNASFTASSKSELVFILKTVNAVFKAVQKWHILLHKVLA